MPNSAGSHRIGGKEDFDYWMAMYDAEIAYCDEYVGRLFEALEAAGVLDDTLIIAATDHGENQGEHSVYGDHWGVYETDAHIWMLARWPHGGVQPGTVVGCGKLYVGSRPHAVRGWRLGAARAVAGPLSPGHAARRA